MVILWYMSENHMIILSLYLVKEHNAVVLHSKTMVFFSHVSKSFTKFVLLLWPPLKTSCARKRSQRMTSLSLRWRGAQTSSAVCGSLNLPLGNPIDLQFVLSSIKSMRTDMKSRAPRWLQWSYLQHFVILIVCHFLHLSFLFSHANDSCL